MSVNEEELILASNGNGSNSSDDHDDDDDDVSFGETNTNTSKSVGVDADTSQTQIQTAAMTMAVAIQKKSRVQSYGKDNGNVNVENDNANNNSNSNCNAGDDMNMIINTSQDDDDDSIATLDQSVSVSISGNVFNLDQFEINHDDDDKDGDDDDGLTANDDSDHKDSKLDTSCDDEQDAFVQDSTQPELNIDFNNNVADTDRIDADLHEQQPELRQGSNPETSSDDEEEAVVQDFTQPELDIDSNNNVADVNADARPADTIDTVTDQDMLDTVDTLFAEADVSTMTTKDIIQSVQDLFQIKLKKDKKKIIKQRLMELVQLHKDSKLETGSDDEQEAFVQDFTQPELDIDSNNNVANGNVAAGAEVAAGPANTIDTVTDQDILDTVDTLFAEADVQTMTTKDIIQSVQDLFQIKLKKDKKKFIKQRLMELVNQQEDSDSQETDAEGGADASPNEGDEHETQEQSDYSDNEDEDEEPTSPSSSSARKKGPSKSKSRPKRTPKKKIPSHLKIHHESLRKRQIMQQKVLQEEMHDDQQSKISTIDRKRAEDIAKKFQTDTIEMKTEREKERIGLIHVLEQRRFKLMMLESSSGAGADCDNDSDSDSEEEDDELEIVGMDSLPARGAERTHDDSTSAAAAMDMEPPAPVSFAKTLGETNAIGRKSSPKSIISYFASNSNNAQKKSNKKVFQNPRATLRNALKAKQFENGNKWLAR